MRRYPDKIALSGRLLLGGAACLSLYLACISLGRTPLPGCGDASSCQDVLLTRWAFVFGVPVSFAGFVLYSLALLLSGAFVRRQRSPGGFEAGAAMSVIIAAAVWFTALQIFVLHTICGWCSATHTLATAGVLLLWCGRRQHSATAVKEPRAGNQLPENRAFRLLCAGAAVAVVGVLALGAPPAQHAVVHGIGISLAAGAVDAKGVTLFGGKYHINPADFPAIGGQAPRGRTAILLSDYTCEFCREYHAALENIAATSQQPIQIVVLPVARTPEAADIQRTMLTLFHADHKTWRAVSALITSGQVPAHRDDVGRIALKMLGTEKWAHAAHASADLIDSQLRLAAEVFEENRRAGNPATLPQLMNGHRILTGAEPDREKILAFLTEEKSPLPMTGPTSPQPGLVVLNPEVELNSLTPGKPVNIQIKVRNQGDAPLKLAWVTLNPGCEVTRLPEEKIPPGEIAAIGLRVTPPSDGADFTNIIKIHSNAPGAPATVILRGKRPLESGRVVSVR